MAGIADRQKWLEEDDERHDVALSLRAGVEQMRARARQFKFMLPNPGEQEPYNPATGKRGISAANTSLGTSITSQFAGSSTLYDLRVTRSDLPNVWAETIESISRLPFRARLDVQGWDPIMQGEDLVDEDGKRLARSPGWVDDIDGNGSSIDQWAQQNFEDSMFEGLTFAFVDNDPRAFESILDRREGGGRPYVTTLHRDKIKRLHWDASSGRPRLVEVAFCQDIRKVDLSNPLDWSDTTVPAVKIVTAGNPDAPEGSPERRVRTRLFVQEEKGAEWVEDPNGAGEIVPEGGGELTEIPLVPFYGKRIGPWRGESPFLNTAWSQVAIWNHNSEISNLAREMCMLIVHHVKPNADMAPPDDGETREDSAGNSARYVIDTDPGAKMTLLESSGVAIDKVQSVVDIKKGDIEKAHHQIQANKPTVAVTASEITLEAVHASSALELWVIQHEHGWQRVLELMALLGGLIRDGEPGGTVSIPHDFGLPSKAMDRLERLFMAGKVSASNYWAEALRQGEIDERHFDVESEIAREQEAALVAGPETF